MGLGIQETSQPTSAEDSAAIAPGIPHDVINEVLDRLPIDSSLRPTLLSCSLITKSWVSPCRRRLFRTVLFTGREMVKWLETFPVPERSPAHYVVDLNLSLGGRHAAPEEFFKYTEWFTNTKKMSVSGTQGLDPVWVPPFGRLPHSVTSLTIDTNIATLIEIRDVMEKLPNLEDLTLSGSLHGVDKDRLRGIGKALKGRFGGKIQLFRLREQADSDIVNMLLEVPTGVYFTEVYVLSIYDCVPSVVKLVEVCGKNLVKLTYAIEHHGGHDSLDQSFDFAKLPNLREAKLTVHWTSGDLLWISASLSTIKPGTSLRLSTLQLGLSGRSLQYIPGAVNERLTEDLRLIDREVTRIRREFIGAVNLIMCRYPGSKPH